MPRNSVDRLPASHGFDSVDWAVENLKTKLYELYVYIYILYKKKKKKQ